MLANWGFTNSTDGVGVIKQGAERADRELASGTTAEVLLQVSAERCVGRGFLGFQSPLLLSTVDQTKVVNASIGLGGLASTNEVRNRDSGQETDDRNNDHDFYEGEAGFAAGFRLHSLVLFYAAVNVVRGVLLLIHSFTLLPLTNRSYGLSRGHATFIDKKGIVSPTRCCGLEACRHN